MNGYDDNVFSAYALLTFSLIIQEKTFLFYACVAEKEGVRLLGFGVLVGAIRTYGIGFVFFHTNKFDW